MGKLIDALTALKTETAEQTGGRVMISRECLTDLIACLEPGPDEPPFVTLEIEYDRFAVNLHLAAGRVCFRGTDEDMRLCWRDEDVELAMHPELVEGLEDIEPGTIQLGLRMLVEEFAAIPGRGQD